MTKHGHGRASTRKVCGRPFTTRDELRRELELLEVPLRGAHDVFNHKRFAQAFVTARDHLLNEFH